MSLCINPTCRRPDHPANDNNRFCQSCGSDLLLENRYRVTRLLSDNNGFSKVYEVDEGGTPKILKVLKENLNTNSKAVDLFGEEAAVLGQLNHPGIPKVDGYFQFQTRNNLGLHCIATEKIDGSNLEDWLQAQGNQPISQQLALAQLKQLAEILHLVHSQQYYHWNIKPTNIMLARSREDRLPSQQLVLIDFSTARELTYIYLAQHSAEDLIAPVVSSGYTPPEQANGQPVPQSDFFALGRTFVYLLTGQHPLNLYDAENDLLHWRDCAPSISPLLADFIEQLMARRPSDRPPNTLAILQRLEEIERELCYVPTTTTTATQTEHETPIWLVVGLLLAFWEQLVNGVESITRSGLRIAVAIVILCLVPTALAFVTPKVICSLGLSSESCPSQEPEKVGDVDYFPPEEGTDSQGRTAEFDIAVLSREYEWKLGSPYLIESGGETIKVNDLKPSLEQQGIQKRLNNPTDIISVGTASCEGSLQTEQNRAFQRAKNIQLLAKQLFSNSGTLKNYHLLNLGKFQDCQNNSNPSETSYQRSLIIIGVSQKTPGLILDEALYNRLKTKPFGDFKLEDYSLGSEDRFKLTN